MDFIKFWIKKDIWTFREAACLLNGVDPNLQMWAPNIIKVNETHEIFNRAIWGDYDIPPIDQFVLRDTIIQFAKDRDLEIYQPLLDQLLIYSSKNIERANRMAWVSALEDHASLKVSAEGGALTGYNPTVFDPIKIDGIAAMFPLRGETNDSNLMRWKKLSRRASEKGPLGTARVSVRGTNPGPTLYDPILVGEWLVISHNYSRNKVNSILRRNLPDRSADCDNLFEGE